MPEHGEKLVAGAIFFGTCAVLLLIGAYVMWPADFFGTAFSEMTAAMLLRAAASLVLAIIGLEFLAALAIVTQADH